MQTFRINDTNMRNVYSTDENLERHFRDARMGEGLEVEDSGPRRGDVKYSFANLLHRQRPLLRSEEHTSELQSLMRISYAVFCLQKKHHIFSQFYSPPIYN